MKSIIALLLIAATLSTLRAAPVETKTIKGGASGPTVRVVVGRSEQPKTMGIDKQLAGLVLKKGQLHIETWETLDDSVPAFSGEGEPDLEIVLRWSDRVPGLKRKSSGTPLSQLPHVSATGPDVTAPWFIKAAGDSYPKDPLEARLVERMPLEGIQQAELHFPKPRDGVVRSRQTRLSRRFVGNALESLGMIEPASGFWPSGLDVSNVICIYDAEGCGYIGGVRLERVVNRTTLDNQVAMICHEDIRDGALIGVRAVVFPGGTAGGIVKALQPDGVGNVRDFVQQGGAYVGVCAGAYFSGSGSSNYARLNHLVQHQPWLKGQKVLEMELTPQGIEILGEEFKTFTNRYNNGPVFLDISDPPEGSPFQPILNLAVFKEAPTRRGVTHNAMVGTSGIHATTFGKGRVMNISAHPETHEELDVLVGRCFGWALGVPKEEVRLLN